MSFGIRALKKVTSNEITDDKKVYVKNLVVGDSTAAYYALLKLAKKNESVKILTSKPTNLNLVQLDWENSLQSIRGLENREIFKEVFPSAEIPAATDVPLFYKDADFKSFGGRAKPCELLQGEEYFTNISTPINDGFLFSEEDKKILGELFEKNQMMKVIYEIEKVEPTTLVDIVNFKIHLADHELIECENLYWARSPKELFKLTNNKDSLAEVFHKLASKIQHKSLLKIRLPLKKKLADHRTTVFIPQSLTHDWGHFLCDFYDGDNKTPQYVNVACFVGEEEVTGESLAKKIKHAKRSLDRVFGKIQEDESREQISFSDVGLSLDIQDDLYEEFKSKEKNIFLIGDSALVPQQYHSTQFLLRSIISVENQISN